MAEYIEREAAIAYIREQSEEWQKAFEELGGESGIYADAYNDLAEDFYRIPATDVLPVVRWIPITERLPKPETEVMIVCNRNGCRFIATAIHEDGTLFTEDSDWVWNDIWEYGRYDEEHDDYIIPEGWWESRCFTPDDVYNCPVDCKVTHWMSMPELPKGEDDG